MANRSGDEAEQEVAVDDHESDESSSDEEHGADYEAAVGYAIEEVGGQELALICKTVGDARAAASNSAGNQCGTHEPEFLRRGRAGPVGARALAAALDNNATLNEPGLQLERHRP